MPNEHPAVMNIIISAGNNFSCLEGHVSFQTSLLIGHFTKLVGHRYFGFFPETQSVSIHEVLQCIEFSRPFTEK